MLTMLLYIKSLLIVKKQLVFFLAPKTMNNLLHRIKCFRMAYVYNFLTKWNTLAYCYMPHWRMMMRQVKSQHSAASKLISTFAQCSPAVKNTIVGLFLCMPMYACQLWSKYTKASMKRLCVACSNTYQIMHYKLLGM